MRRTSWITAAAAAACLASAAPAAASSEIKDACGPGAIGGPPAYVVEPQVPWLDLCDSDVSGFAGAGSLRGVRFTLKLAGDATARPPGLTRYTAYFFTDRCSVSLILNDLASGTAGWVGGSCDGRSEPCPVVPSCWQSYSGPSFEAKLTSFQIAGNTVTLSFDPNTLPRSAPKSLGQDLAAGVIHNPEAITWVQAGTDNHTSGGEIADIAEGGGSVSLG